MRPVACVVVATLTLGACVGEPTALEIEPLDPTPEADELAMVEVLDPEQRSDGAIAPQGTSSDAPATAAATGDGGHEAIEPEPSPTPGFTLAFPSPTPAPAVPDGFVIALPTSTTAPAPPPGFSLSFPTATPVSPTATPGPTTPPAPTNPPVPTSTPAPTTPPAPTSTPAPTNPPAPTATAPAPTTTPVPPTPTAVPPTPTAAPPTATPTSGGVSALEAQMITLVNQVRADAGVAPLTTSTAIADVARAWSATLPTSFQHNPSVGSQIPGGWYAWGENIAYNGSMTAAQTALENSSGHYANMVNPSFTHIGIGIHEAGGRVYVTQVFAGY